MRDNVDSTDKYVTISLEEIEDRRFTYSIFDDQKELQNTTEHDEVPDYLKSYQKAQAAALLSHSASTAHQQKTAAGPNDNFSVSGQLPSRATPCPSCNSCARARACAPASSVTPAPRKKTSIFKLVATRLKRFGRKNLSVFNEMPATASTLLAHGAAIAVTGREASGTGPEAKALRPRQGGHR
jgi:hypothetical protein